MADDEERSFAEIGRGILDWEAIHAASLEAGVECYCVEQDRCVGDPLESARISREFMRRLLGQ
jgi:sugar phosphate isomerase/epimerase